MMQANYAFDFGKGEACEGYVKITDQTRYEGEGCGFERGGQITAIDRGEPDGVGRDFCIPCESAFLVDVPNGIYTVELFIGDAGFEAETTVRTEEGRLVLYRLQTLPGCIETSRFSHIVSNGRLMLRFSGRAPRINAMKLTASEQTRRLFIAGDSTVADQPVDSYPYAGWGQTLPMWLKADVAVDNRAVSGRSSKSFIAEGRLDAIWAAIRAGDYLLIQFGHNDQKPDEPRHTEPFSTYKQHLRLFIEGARKRGAQPILLTSVQRRYFDEYGGLTDTHGDYVTAMKELAVEEDVPCIDLAAKSRELFERLGPEGTKSLLLWGAPGEFIRYPNGIQDNTHFQEAGAVRIAELVAEGLRELKLHPLSMFVRE